MTIGSLVASSTLALEFSKRAARLVPRLIALTPLVLLGHCKRRAKREDVQRGSTTKGCLEEGECENLLRHTLGAGAVTIAVSSMPRSAVGIYDSGPFRTCEKSEKQREA
jgi:hypothetical protein